MVTNERLSALQINRARQEEKQKRMPKDRIAFRPEAATEDMVNFKAYSNGDMSLQTLCKYVAKANLLDGIFPDGIPEEMMLNELRLTGWDRRWASMQK